MRKFILVATAVIAVALLSTPTAFAGGTGGTGDCVAAINAPVRCTVADLTPTPTATPVTVVTTPPPVATTIPASTPVVTTPRPATGIKGVPTPPTTVAAVIVPAIPKETGGNTGGGESAATTPAPGAPQETAAALPKEEAPAEPAASSTPAGVTTPVETATPKAVARAVAKAVAKATPVAATASVVSGVLAPALVPVASDIAVSPVTSSLSLSWLSAMWPQGFLALFVCGGAALGTVLAARRRQANKLDTDEIDFDLGILSLLEEEVKDEVSATDIKL